MTIGVFVQVNTESQKARSNPIGYVIQEDGCWEWIGSKIRGGYGEIRDLVTRRHALAHRWMYEREHGPIPDGHQCHHVCANKSCVNPAHLEIVRAQEHYDKDSAKREGTRRSVAVRRAKTHCPQGHPYAGENLYVYRGLRSCIACRRESLIRSRRAKGVQPRGSRAHCSRGHPYTGDNLYVSPTTGRRSCRACARRADRMRVRKKGGR